MNKQYVQWFEDEVLHHARWLSQSEYAPPARMVVVDDSTSADEAYRLACAGTSMLYRGDFHNARQLLQAITRRIERTEHSSKQRQLKKAAHQSAKTVTESTKTSQHIPSLFHQQRHMFCL